jgi:hypothetical protein
MLRGLFVTVALLTKSLTVSYWQAYWPSLIFASKATA